MHAQVDDAVAERYLSEAAVPADVLKRAVRRATLKLALQPVFMGSAFKNRGEPCSGWVGGWVG